MNDHKGDFLCIERGFREEKLAELVTLHKQGMALSEACSTLALNDTEKKIAESLYAEFETRCHPEEIKDIVDVAMYRRILSQS